MSEILWVGYPNDDERLEKIERKLDEVIEYLNKDLEVEIPADIKTLTEEREECTREEENDLLQSELAALNARTDLANALIEYERAGK